MMFSTHRQIALKNIQRYITAHPTHVSQHKAFLSNISSSQQQEQRPPVALIIGAGDGLGQAIAKRFSKEKFTICPVRRHLKNLQQLTNDIKSTHGIIHPFGVDCRDENAVVELIRHIETTIGPIEITVFNIGANIKHPLHETTSRRFQKVWQMACYSGFLVGREASRPMTARGRGTIIFTGATASVRGSTGFSAFAGAKHGLRALAQSMARELGPRGVHVAHVVIDGAVDTPWVREMFGGEAERLGSVDGLLNPNDVAENYVWLYRQPRNCWTFELDLRPWCERW